jgi:hypothetical protein
MTQQGVLSDERVMVTHGRTDEAEAQQRILEAVASSG